jgi:hypothetical protein
MNRLFLLGGFLLFLISCKTADLKKDFLIEKEDKTVNLYAFIGKKIFVQKVERDTTLTEKFIGLDGDTVVQKVIPFDQKFEAKYQVKKNVFNELETDTVSFLVYDHYGRPQFEDYENVLLYISFDQEDENFYHQKYQFDPVKKTKNGNWEGLNGESIEELFIEKKNGLLTARGLFDE